MAKEKEEIKEVKEVYQLTETVRHEGYYAKIDGREFAVSRSRKIDSFTGSGMPTKKRKLGSLMLRVETNDGIEWSESGEITLTDLTETQKRELLHAGVVIRV